MAAASSDWLSPQDVGDLAGGFSAAFIRTEIHAGQIKATYFLSRRGRLGRWRIQRDDAIAYVRRITASQTAITDSSEITP